MSFHGTTTLPILRFLLVVVISLAVFVTPRLARATPGYIAGVEGQWVKQTGNSTVAVSIGQVIENGAVLKLISLTADADGRGSIAVAKLNGALAFKRKCMELSECANVVVALGDAPAGGAFTRLFRLVMSQLESDSPKFITAQSRSDTQIYRDLVVDRVGDNGLDLTELLKGRVAGDYLIKLTSVNSPQTPAIRIETKWDGSNGKTNSPVPSGLYAVELEIETANWRDYSWLLVRKARAARKCREQFKKVHDTVGKWASDVSEEAKTGIRRAALRALDADPGLCPR